MWSPNQYAIEKLASLDTAFLSTHNDRIVSILVFLELALGPIAEFRPARGRQNMDRMKADDMAKEREY
jgi:hypothetical protein